MGLGLVLIHGISVHELVGQGKSGVPGVPVNYVRETAQERKENRTPVGFGKLFKHS